MRRCTTDIETVDITTAKKGKEENAAIVTTDQTLPTFISSRYRTFSIRLMVSRKVLLNTTDTFDTGYLT